MPKSNRSPRPSANSPCRIETVEVEPVYPANLFSRECGHNGTRTPSYLIWLCVSFLIVGNVLALASAKPGSGTPLNSIPFVPGLNAQSHPEGARSEVSAELASEFIKKNSVVSPNSSGASTTVSPKEIRVVYLVPSDRTIRQDYVSAIQSAIVHLQAFYQGQLGSGFAFSLHSPVVEVFQTSHVASFYSTGGNATQTGFWTSVLGDGFALSGGGFNDPNYRWIYYVDADPICGQVTGGTSGVALLPANDLRGLTGQPNVPPCVGQPPDLNGPCRWVGGLGHELGHAFGLTHPPGCDQGTCTEFARHSLMYLGYIDYPNTYFLDDDKSALLATGFFSVLSPLQSPDCAVPTEAKLETVAVTGYEDGAYVEWRTGNEVDNLGFNIYREENGERVLVNPQIVAGSALLTGSGLTLAAGRSYGWWDAGATRGAIYWLEDVDVKGQTKLNGPFKAETANPSGADVTRKERQARLLSQLGSIASATSHVVERVSEITHPTPNQTDLQIALARQAGVKLFVKQEGWYHVTQPELVAGGLTLPVDPNKLQLYAEAREVPMLVVTGKNGGFDNTSYIEFYGCGLDTTPTDLRTYWLMVGTQPGKRIPQSKGEGVSASLSTFPYTVERKDRTIYFAGLLNGDKENFFGAVTASQPVEQIFTLSHVGQSADLPMLDLTLQGVTVQAHRVLVQVNNVSLGEVVFSNQQLGTAKFNLPPALLKEGANTVRLVAQSGSGDVSLVDTIRLTYPHTLQADNNLLKFTAQGKQGVTVSGFTSKTMQVFDVTDANGVIELSGKIKKQKDGYSITALTKERGTRTLLALTSEQTRKPVQIKANVTSDWHDESNAADLVMISDRNFIAALQPLKELRQKEGLRVEVADVEDLYDEFNFGEKSPQAIKDFLAYTARSWNAAPHFLLFVGDATYDTKNYLGLGDYDLVPTKLLDTGHLETASDDWFSDFNNDGISDMATGRLPVRSVSEAAAVIAKIVRYSQAIASESALLVSDQNEGFNFEQVSDSIRTLLPPSLRVEELKRGQLDASKAKVTLLEAILRGQKVVNYVGHGSVNLWRGNLLSATDAAGLTNSDALPLFVMMDCLNGYFQEATTDSLAEALLKNERGGAIAIWASSALTTPNEQAAMSRALYGLLFDENARQKTIGEVVVRAKEATSNPDLRRTWTLIGDPTTKIR